VLGESGQTHAGCNVEFENYSNTIHAEEAAIAKAVAAGERSIRAVAVVTNGDSIAWPCGMCLQSLYEIGGERLRVIGSNGPQHEVKNIKELLPYGFRLERVLSET
jgi:cytidine deaminase